MENYTLDFAERMEINCIFIFRSIMAVHSFKLQRRDLFKASFKTIRDLFLIGCKEEKELI